MLVEPQILPLVECEMGTWTLIPRRYGREEFAQIVKEEVVVDLRNNGANQREPRPLCKESPGTLDFPKAASL